MKKEISKYFDFSQHHKINNVSFSDYNGWNSLLVVKFSMKKNDFIDDKKINDQYPDLQRKQKIFVVTKGQIKLEFEKKFFTMSEYDSVDFIRGDEKYKIESLENSSIYMVSAKDLGPEEDKPIFFNFKKNIESKNLWGGKIISRPYEGKGITLVLFDLKKGFEFEDKGHANEQITWLISGEMNFYANKEHKTLNSDLGVDIGPFHVHGGVSKGAIGFDVFFPKRRDVSYKN